jgi:AcrR family transcriptional regulator
MLQKGRAVTERGRSVVTEHSQSADKGHGLQIQRTKRWIFEAMLLLLDEKPYGQIGISEITEKAGVARTSFYRNFTGKDDVILQYLDDILSDCLFQIIKEKGENGQKIFSLRLPIPQLHEQRGNLKKLLDLDKGLSLLLLKHFLDWVDAMIDQHSKDLLKREKLTFRWTVKFLAGGFLHVILDWIHNESAVPEEQLSAAFDEFIRLYEPGEGGAVKIVME